MKTFSLSRIAGICLLALSFILPLAASVAAQNNSNAGGTATPATSATSSQTSTSTTTTTTQTTRPTETTQTTDSGFPWIWVIVLGLVAIVAIAFFATRRRPRDGDRV